ncbi:hypothetical protein FM106_19220 [Brachybacterium faecium]|nr:hypothetical protein FM106_19220 [Brachybacterium faecium]
MRSAPPRARALGRAGASRYRGGVPRPGIPDRPCSASTSGP